jgi:hypothetical protein
MKKSAVLDFMLPFDTLLDSESIATFEDTLEEFLWEELSESSEGTKFNYFNVTVVSQKVVASDEVLSDEELSNVEPEPVRRRSLEEMSLIISVLIDAIVSQVDPAVEINFQREVMKTVTRKRARFFDELFATEAFEELDPTAPEKPEDSNTPLKTHEDKDNTAAIASTAACGVVLGSIAVLFFVIRRRREGGSDYIAQKDLDVPSFEIEPSGIAPPLLDSPPLDYAHYDDDDVISSLDDDEMMADADRDSKVDICDDVTDKWSLDDAFPFQRSEALGMPHSQLTDSDEEDELKDILITNDKSVCESNGSPSSKILELFEEKRVDNEIVDESVKPPSAPKSIMKSMFKFSCFADNTFKEQEEEGSVKKSSVAPNSRLFEVRVPPGPLGIIVDNDNSPRGGTFIAEVKATSPLKHVVSVGDKIVMVDDVDTSKKSAAALGQWIAKKPYTEEQVLIVMAKEECDIDTGDDMEDMSV